MDNVRRFGPVQDDYSPTRSGPSRRDWAATLDAVHQAAEMMRSTENHSKEVEARGLALAERALKELKISENRIQAAEAAQRAADARTKEAEARAREAEEWLSRVHEAIVDHLITRRPDGARESAAA
jgi:hypothetical protein